MSFDGKRVSPEGRPIPDVGYRIEAFLAHAGTGDVNAIPRDQLFIPAQVDGRDRIFGAITAAAAAGRQDTKWPSQQMAGAACSSLGQKFADLRARNGLASQP